MTNSSNYNFSTTVSHVTGALLHCLREFKGIKQTDMAQKIEMSTSGLSKLEKGETNISIEQIFIFAQQFGLKSSQFMYLLEVSIETINQKSIFVVNTKSKVVQIAKTNNVPVVMSIAALLGLATGSPLTALGMAAASGIWVQSNADNKAQATITNELQLLTDIGTLKNIIQQSVIAKYETLISKS